MEILYPVLCMCIAALIGFGVAVFLRYQIKPDIQYTCNGDGTCSQAVDGKYASMDECLDNCDRAMCFPVDDSQQCIQTEGVKTNPTFADCNKTCGGTTNSYVCDTSVGCRPALANEIGKYSDDTCNYQCKGYDLSSNGYCELLPLGDGRTEVTYKDQQTCENENYTWTCTNYTTDDGGPSCVQDDHYIEGHHFNSKDCMDNCNPNGYATCTTTDRDTATYYSSDGTLRSLASYCEGKQEGDSCTPINYANFSFTGTCGYCARTDGLSELYCQNWF